MRKLKTDYLEKIRKNRALKKKLIDYFEVSETTLYTYLRINDSALAHWGAVDIIADYLNESPENLIEKP